MTDALPVFDDLALSFEQILNGGRLEFEAAGGTFYLRQPTVAERDQAMLLTDMERARLRARSDMQGLTSLPLPPERQAEIRAEISELVTVAADDDLPYWRQRWIRERLGDLEKALKRSAADELIDVHAALFQRRWLAQRCLVNGDGDPIAQGDEAWNQLPALVQDTATARMALLLRAIYIVPFSQAGQSEAKSASD